MKNIEILSNSIFKKHPIISGVTKKSKGFKFGFSISQAETYSEDEVIEMKQLLALKLDIKYEALQFQKQVHSDVINIVSCYTENLVGDAFVSNTKGLVLNVSIADCAAVLIYDPINEAIAAIHSGWKGTQQNICAKSINIMVDKFQSNPKNLICYISPCAGGDVYEVENDVAKFFPKSTKKISESKFLFDNRKEIELQLKNCGIIDGNIEISDICTMKDTDYHSFIRDKSLSGRMCAFIRLSI
ncbi:MAG: peptidoglycan editing factor PgeF [Candidatus Kapabacteria bacterium]|nr:peptidoglycan editing factor PgeF [Candidatus Kapabacteria bacterium]